ncbi:phosphatase PAP2 family protein [Pedobacter agri]|uniref:phosphatase PAP2 family protein n=1 Tax=Pedobacter agri TaxID=454586 RepID=UPI0029305ED9|nr:phosphatase PAP2 family protein [Pedobacter agri]
MAATCFAQQQDTISTVRLNPNVARNTSEEIKPEKFKVVHFIAPAVLIGYGFASIYDQGALKALDLSTKAELREDYPRFAYHLDDYAQFAPALAVYGLNLAGIKGKHNMFDASMIYITSATIMGISTHLVKKGIGRIRPDGSGYNSFPSGHTASAFAAAEFLYQEFKYKSPWIGYAGYFVAAATGTLRMYNNKHWFSDVVAGAGFGIAATKLGYLLYPNIKRLLSVPGHHQNISFSPIYENHHLGYKFSYRL